MWSWIERLGLEKWFRRDPRRIIPERLAAGDAQGVILALSAIEEDAEMIEIARGAIADCLHRHQGQCPPEGMRIVIDYLLRRGRAAHQSGDMNLGPDAFLALFFTPVIQYRNWKYLQEIAGSRELTKFVVDEARRNLDHYRALEAKPPDLIAAHHRLAEIYHLLKRYDQAKKELCHAIELARRAHQRTAGLVSLGWVALLEITSGDVDRGKTALQKVLHSLRKDGKSGEECILLLERTKSLHSANPLVPRPR